MKVFTNRYGLIHIQNLTWNLSVIFSFSFMNHLPFFYIFSENGMYSPVDAAMVKREIKNLIRKSTNFVLRINFRSQLKSTKAFPTNDKRSAICHLRGTFVLGRADEPIPAYRPLRVAVMKNLRFDGL